jgi:ATP-dependent helicase/nuclease subunit A
MSRQAPTPEQAAAIEATGLDVLLEAGAGTGKTGVMVDRYCRLSCDEGIDPDAILAFTFTDKAATELRRRIRAELERRARKGEERARGLLPGIGGAWVTTIHGFCSRLLAGHPIAAGIDPGFRVLDTPEAERAAREAFEEALEAFLAGGGAAHEETVAAYEVDGLRSIVTGIHAELRSRGVAHPRLPAPPRPNVTEALRLAVEAAATTIEELKPTNSSRELVERALAVLGPTGETVPSLEELAALRPDSKAKAMAAYKEAIDAVVARVAEAGDGGEAYGHLAGLLALYSNSFEGAKGRRAAIDFEDLQILAAGLLEKAKIGEDYRGRFKHLMVDEFQDTNALQLRLIEALRGPDSELMVVGDEFQSIYGFRHADLEVFREQRRLMEEGPSAGTMSLSGNFRSRPEVIGAVNTLGHELLGESFQLLRVGAEPAAPLLGDGAAVELLLTARDGWDEEGVDLMPSVDGRTPLNCLAEARFVAERMRRLADSGVPRSEMVVLLRAFTHLDAYEDSLERAGLRPYVVGGRGYWSQQQVADVCALLATIANPLDDWALFGALASPACGLSPDTLWLLRAAAGKRRRVWPAVERAGDLREADLAEPERLSQIPDAETALLRRFAEAVASLRERGTSLSLTKLVEAVVTETGYDLAVLMRPQGEARFANVRKLMRLAAEFESREGRDLRGFLDFLAARAEGDAEAQAATAIEGHDGVRIMTIHNAKGLEFDVVAVPDLSRSLLAGSRASLLALGREAEEPRIGMQLRRLGAPAINLFSYGELCEEGNARDSEEGLRLFHVAATRARERLILSGVVKPGPGKETKPGTPVIERIVDAFGIDRESNSALAVPAPQPRAGLDAEFSPSEIAVQVSLPSSERAAELTATAREADEALPLGEGPAPLARPPFPAPTRFLSYTAISELLEEPDRQREEGKGGAEEDRAAHGIAVHSLLEWSQANGWCEPPPDLAGRFILAAGLDPDAEGAEALEAIRAWLGCAFFAERVRDAERSRAEVPFLLALPGAVMRGSIDLLVEAADKPPRVIDYKTDRLGATKPAKRVERYEVQRDLYALAASEARGVDEVEVAYVFLERPGEPFIETLDRAAIDAGRRRLEAKIERLG